MKRVTPLLAVLLVTVIVSAPAVQAGVYTDELSKCLVRSTTSEDKTAFVRWIFSIMGAHPDVKDLAVVTDGKRAEMGKQTGALLMRLLTESCVNETREAFKNEGDTALGGSFSVLAQVAVRELLVNPEVQAAIKELALSIDEEKLKAAFAPAPAGEAPAPAPAPVPAPSAPAK